MVHLAYEDVEAYAKWIGKELPTEAEWEFAARGGLNGAEFVWGDAFTPDGKPMANTWQGEFPWQNLKEDGFEGTAPVGSFPANGYGLYEMAGNVWEWTTDWYQEHKEIPQSCCASFNPRGGERDKSYDPHMTDIKIPRKVMKGGLASVRAELLPALSTGSAYAPAHRHFDVSSRFSLHRSGEQVARFGLSVLGPEKRREFCLPQRRKGAKFGEIKVGAAKKVGRWSGAFASLASLRPCSGHAWREKNPRKCLAQGAKFVLGGRMNPKTVGG